MKPLYKWAGGKNKMIPKYLETPGIPVSGFDTFVEPFFGGGAMTIWMLKNSSAKHFVINDTKTDLMDIYAEIKRDVNGFIESLEVYQQKYMPLSKSDRKKLYYDLREEYIETHPNNAALLYFLMLTGFNGIWQTTKKSNGRYATPSGLLNEKVKVFDEKNVREWHEFLQNATICSGDWSEIETPTEKSFFFMDPPYRDSFTSYGGEFDDIAQKNLIDRCNTLDKMGHYVFLCNRDDGNDDFFTQSKGNLLTHHYDITYTAGRRKKTTSGFEAKKAREILLYSSSVYKSSSVLDFM